MHDTKPEGLVADTPAANFRVRLAVLADVMTLVALMREFYAESGFGLDETWATAAFNQLSGDPDRGAAWLIEERDGMPPAWLPRDRSRSRGRQPARAGSVPANRDVARRRRAAAPARASDGNIAGIEPSWHKLSQSFRPTT